MRIFFPNEDIYHQTSLTRPLYQAFLSWQGVCITLTIEFVSFKIRVDERRCICLC
ncbi:hypothetical protein MBAV_002777 [Candidatus Magnetobacterium bavaricum]|uniref:Uncharacterized protein n=1 Tax=Candidatus Magnetobacterium bavaricum TaxID=29290 RepID=A0A0F3GT49_9BACT|nr:hypothetical protein MBAV_002777 [Candidatus Magnetobacterium bavaricum]